MSDKTNVQGTFVLAKEELNGAGWPSFTFAPIPYVHRSSAGAEQEARRLAKKNNCDFAVFKKVCSVHVEREVTNVKAVDLDNLAGTLARVMQERNRHMDIVSCRSIVDEAMKNLIFDE